MSLNTVIEAQEFFICTQEPVEICILVNLLEISVDLSPDIDLYYRWLVFTNFKLICLFNNDTVDFDYVGSLHCKFTELYTITLDIKYRMGIVICQLFWSFRIFRTWVFSSRQDCIISLTRLQMIYRKISIEYNHSLSVYRTYGCLDIRLGSRNVIFVSFIVGIESHHPIFMGGCLIHAAYVRRLNDRSIECHFSWILAVYVFLICLII